MNLQLSGENLYCRALQESDVNDLTQILSTVDAQKYSIYGKRTKAQVTEFLKSRLIPNEETSPSELFLPIILRAEQKVVGEVDATIDRESDSAEIGIALQKDYWGEGYGQEAVKLLCGHLFNTVKLNRVYALCHFDNIGSFQLFKGVGFTHEGTLREHVKVDGKYRSSHVLSLLKKEN